MDIRKQVLKIFQSGVLDEFRAYSLKHQMDLNLENLIVYLIEHDFIGEAVIRRFSVLQEFDAQFKKHEYNKTQTVNSVANKLNLSERTIWSALKHMNNENQNQAVGLMI